MLLCYSTVVLQEIHVAYGGIAEFRPFNWDTGAMSALLRATLCGIATADKDGADNACRRAYTYGAPASGQARERGEDTDADPGHDGECDHDRDDLPPRHGHSGTRHGDKIPRS